jgi:hypothetical protein
MIKALALLAGLGIAVQSEPDWIMTANSEGYRYASPDVGEFGVDGVCSMTPSSATCWRPDGTPDPVITQRVEAHLSLPDYEKLGFAYRRKNVFVIWHGPIVGNTFATIYFGGQAHRPGPGLWQAWSVQRDHTYEFAGWLPVADNQTSADLVLSIPVPLTPVRDALRGGSFRVGEFTVKYGKLDDPKTVMPFEGFSSQIGGGDPWSSQEFTITPDPASAGLQLWPSFLGSDGKKLQARWEPETPNVKSPKRHWVPAGTSSATNGATGYWAFSGDRKRIAAIQIQPAYTRWVTIHDVALRSK